MSLQKGKLYLLPSPIIENGLDTISKETIDAIHALHHFIGERLGTELSDISATRHRRKMEELHFEEIPEEGMRRDQVEAFLAPALEGQNIGLMSEAGLPAIADPGNQIVHVAQKLGIRVVLLA